MSQRRYVTHDAGPALTLAEAKGLVRGTILYSRTWHGSDGRPGRWRVSGKPCVWITRPSRVRVPVKHGLYTCDYVEEWCLETVSLSEHPTKVKRHV